MKKFHIGKNGPSPCNARKNPCPIGGEHFNSFKDAETEFHKQYNNSIKVSKTFKSDKDFTNKSKELAFILRHKPESINLKVDGEGFGKVTEVLSGMNIKIEQLKEIIELDSKGRYEFSRDGEMVRARQGHSFKVDLKLEELDPPELLYHGTTVTAWKSIKKSGLKPMQKHAVHLSESLETAMNVASRRKDETIILIIDSQKMFESGYKFNKTSNNVWLTDDVPAHFIRPDL